MTDTPQPPPAPQHTLAWIVVAALAWVSPFLTPGELGTVMVIAADRKQARVIYRYATALLHEVPMLKAMIQRETAEAIELTNGIRIEILTASFRTVRGYTLIAALCDEIAFWRSDESANPDSEIIGAIRPAMATIAGAVLLCASSPYARRGAIASLPMNHQIDLVAIDASDDLNNDGA